MKTTLAPLFFLLFFVGGLGASDHIESNYLDPKEYTDLDFVDRSSETGLNIFDRELKQSSRIAKLIGEGRVLELYFYDINMAGEIIPAPRFDEQRVFREVYPPKFHIRYVLKDSAGKVVDSGETKIADLNFSKSLHRPKATEIFFFELNLLEDWLERVVDKTT